MTPITPPTPRLARLLLALSRGPLNREEVDRIAPATNGPHYIGTLRRKYGLALHCDHVPCVTVDGEWSWHGRYCPTAEDHQKIASILAAVETEGNA